MSIGIIALPFDIFYKYRKDVFSVVHTHSKYATAISCTNIEGLPAINYLLAVAGTDVPCAEYATYGTVKLAKNDRFKY